MSGKELKEILKEKIDYVQDEALIQRLLDMVNEEAVPYKLNESQRRSIERGLEDVRAGRVVSNEDVQKELDEWLGKDE